jgi:hypothetical protein
MGQGLSIGNLALETFFGLVAVFLLFAPKLFGWSGWSYIGGIIFLILTFIVLMIKN